MFLVGVFLGSSLPPVQPPRLDFSPNALTEHFLSLSPALGQVFFIGDGLTGTGTGDTQSFVAPQDAATLYLGVADGFQFTGLPGYYGDDVGSISGDINVGVPEPGNIALVGARLVGIAGMLRRKLR